MNPNAPLAETLMIEGKDLRVGDQLRTWYGRYEQVLEMKDYRNTYINDVRYKVFTACCTNDYNITIFEEAWDIRIAPRYES